MTNYDNEVKSRWGETEAYKEYTEKTKVQNDTQKRQVKGGLEAILVKFANLKKNGQSADSLGAQALVKELQDYITKTNYTCTNEILFSLGQMYVADLRFKTNIDKFGEGTAEFISNAIKVYCTK